MPPASQAFVDSYDQKILHARNRTLYEGSDFYNVGDWSGGTHSLAEACKRLVERHLEPWPKDLADAQPRRVLDVGCGLGAGTAVIAKRLKEADVLGINLSELQIEHARRHHPSAEFRVMDAAHLDFADRAFDLVISVEAAFHFRTREAFFEQAFRVLRPGGRLVLSDILFRTTKWIGSWSVPEANALADPASYADLCRGVGFQVVEMQNVTDVTWLGFCRHLRDVAGMDQLAAQLEKSVSAYLLTRLVKPRHRS